MSHRNARPCGYADGLTMPVSWMLRGSRHRSSSHLKDFLRRAQGQGGGSGEHLGDVVGEEGDAGRGGAQRGREVGREGADSPPWPCNYIQKSARCMERGVGSRRALLIGQPPGRGRGSDRK